MDDDQGEPGLDYNEPNLNPLICELCKGTFKSLDQLGEQQKKEHAMVLTVFVFRAFSTLCQLFILFGFFNTGSSVILLAKSWIIFCHFIITNRCDLEKALEVPSCKT